MENEFLKELTLTENKIRTALEENNFLKVSQLSKTFDEQIKNLTHQLQCQPDVSKTDITLLKELNEKLLAIEKATITQFRKFSSETSTKTKMHNAYKNYGG